MTFKQLWTSIKTAWQSRPLALVLPIIALGVYWWSHGHTLTTQSLPSMGEWVAGTTLLFTKFGRVMEVFVGPPAPETLPPPVVAPVLKGPGPIVGLLLLLGLGITVAACQGCATTGTTGTSTPVATTLKDCGANALGAAEGLLGTVTTDLSSGAYDSLLTQLEITAGAQVVKCAVELATSQFSAKAAHADDALVQVSLAHGQEFLKDHP